VQPLKENSPARKNLLKAVERLNQRVVLRKIWFAGPQHAHRKIIAVNPDVSISLTAHI